MSGFVDERFGGKVSGVGQERRNCGEVVAGLPTILTLTKSDWPGWGGVLAVNAGKEIRGAGVPAVAVDVAGCLAVNSVESSRYAGEGEPTMGMQKLVAERVGHGIPAGSNSPVRLGAESLQMVLACHPGTDVEFQPRRGRRCSWRLRGYFQPLPTCADYLCSRWKGREVQSWRS